MYLMSKEMLNIQICKSTILDLNIYLEYSITIKYTNIGIKYNNNKYSQKSPNVYPHDFLRRQDFY